MKERRKSSVGNGNAKFFWDNVHNYDEGQPEPQEQQQAPSVWQMNNN